MSARPSLLKQVWLGSAPLFVWALHFTVCYVWVGMACSPALIDAEAPHGTVLLTVSALALGLCALLLGRARAALLRLGETATLLDWAVAASAVLALAGVAWTSLPLLLLAGCG